jgi:hypothetical protein
MSDYRAEWCDDLTCGRARKNVAASFRKHPEKVRFGEAGLGQRDEP